MNTTKRSVPAPAALTRALRDFLSAEVGGAVVLLVGSVIALAWANSPWQESYHDLWATQLRVELGAWHLELTLRECVNEGLMAVFFLVVGLEVKRELLQGELRSRRRAALPVLAALGGMVLPAALYALVTIGSGAGDGWGIPMATDIAFALGVLALVAPGLSTGLRVFLLALAIVDDIGAIVVVAVFYSESLAPEWLAAAAAALVMVLVARHAHLTYTPLFVLLGAVAWVSLHEAGVHATIAGVAMGLLVPATPDLDREIIETRGHELLDVFSPTAARGTSKLARRAVSQLEWLEATLHPWTSFLIVPAFALANAGVTLSADALGDAATSPVTLGVIVGLVVGKTVGIASAAWVACRVGLAELPSDATWRQLIGTAALGGIGFTVSLFITALAFGEGTFAAEAKVGIFVASLLAAVVAMFMLRGTDSRHAGLPS